MWQRQVKQRKALQIQALMQMRTIVYAVCGQKTTASPAVEEFEKEVASFALRVSRKIWRA
jgi:hypothetical protein